MKTLSKQEALELVGKYHSAVRVLLDLPEQDSPDAAELLGTLCQLSKPESAKKKKVLPDFDEGFIPLLVEDDVDAAFNILARFYDAGLCYIKLIRQKTGFTSREVRDRLTRLRVAHKTNRNAASVAYMMKNLGLDAAIKRARTVTELLDLAARWLKPR